MAGLIRSIIIMLPAALMLLACSALPSDAQTSTTSRYNVKDYGAKGDGVTNDTAAFQNALNAANAAGGGIVFAPRGNYRIATYLTIPSNVTLEGVWQCPTAWTENKGTTLLAVYGHGNEDATPFIRTHGSNCTIKGITIYYPNQPKTGTVPIPYPWTVKHVAGDNPTIIDCLFVNPYKAVEFVGAGRHLIRNLYGNPIYRGIYVDRILDVGRIENVHFWPFGVPWTGDTGLSKWINENGIAFIFGRTDWQYVVNTFCFGYKIGYQFIRTENGTSNGNYVGIGADWCINPVMIEEVERFGTLITNGEFVANASPDAVSVTVNAANLGTVSFSNCSFWGASKKIADISGTGAATFTGCNFLQWDKNSSGEYAITSRGGRLTVSGCFFQDFERARKDVEVLTGTKSAVIMGNQSAGSFEVKNEIGSKAQVGLNVGG